METERFNTVGIKDKIEIGLSVFGFPFEWPFVRARFRTVLNVYDKGTNDLFANISIAPFIGISVNNSILVKERQNHEHSFYYYYFHNYLGVSVETRKLTGDIYSLELFASPYYSLTNNISYFLPDYDNMERIDFLAQSLNIPLGLRYIFGKRAVKISIKSGIGHHFTFDLKRISTEDSSDYYQRIKGSYSFKSSYSSAFAEFGIHFATRRINVERRKQLNLER